MIDIPIIIIVIVWLHFFADFILQTRQMAVNKSSSIKWLPIHAMVYSLPFFVISPLYAIINGALHWFIDLVSSRLSARAWTSQDYRLFFIIVGADQTLHFTCLFSTYILLF